MQQAAKTKAETAQGAAETAEGKAETAQGKAETAQGAAAISAAASDVSARSSRAASLAGGGWADHRDLSTDDLTNPAGVGTQEYQFVIPDINLVQYFVDTSKARLDFAGGANLTEFIMDLPDPVKAVPVAGGDDEGQIFSVMIVKKNEDGIPIKVYPEGANVTIDGKDKVGGFVVPYDIANNAYVLTIQLERNADGTRKKDTNNVDIPDNWKVISLGGGGPKVDLSLYATKNKSKTVIRGNTFLGKYFESIDDGVTLDVWDDNNKNLPKVDILTAPFEFYGKVSDLGNTAEFSGDYAAQYATFSGGLSAEYARFSGDYAAQYATFSGYQSAADATFSGYESATYATFSGYQSATYAIFSGDYAAQSATFSGYQAAQDAIFNGNYAAQYATFSGYRAAQSATFSGYQAAQEARFSGNEAARSAIFNGDQCLKYASFEGAGVLDSAELYRADLTGTSFRDVVFKAGFKCPKYVNAGYTAKASSGRVNGCD